MCRFVVIVVTAATLGLDIAAQEGWATHAISNKNSLLDHVDDNSIVASHLFDEQQHELDSQRGYPQHRRLLSSWTDEPPPSSPSTSSPRSIKKSVVRLLDEEQQQQPSASANEPVCSHAQSMLAKHNFIVDKSGDRQTCSYCHNHHVWDDMPFPSNLSTPHDIAAYQEAEWSRSGSSLYEVPLYNFSCSNACATCFSTNTSNTENDNDSSTYCGFIEAKEHFVLKPTTTSTLTERSNSNSNSNGNLFYVLDLVAQSFDNAAELCLVYDSSTTTETGKVCYGTMSVDHNDDESTSDNPQASRRNSRIDRVCYIEYNGMRCHSCREYYTSDATCIAADCSNLETDHALPSWTSSASARLDSCSATDQFTGPLRFVQTLGVSRRQTTTLTTTTTTTITTRGGTCFDQGAPETVAFTIIATNTSPAPTPTANDAAGNDDSEDADVSSNEDSGDSASNSSNSSSNGNLATTKNNEVSSNKETFSTSRCDDTSGVPDKYRGGDGTRMTIAILVAAFASTMLPLT